MGCRGISSAVTAGASAAQRSMANKCVVASMTRPCNATATSSLQNVCAWWVARHCWRTVAAARAPAPLDLAQHQAQEQDARFVQHDGSALHAFSARQTFVCSIAEGAAHADLVQAALAVAAEDDALGARSTRWLVGHPHGCLCR